MTIAGAATDMFVSLSHSGGLVACAATTLGPIGIDLEVAKPGRNLAGIAEAAFGPAERREWAERGPAGFYRIWTLREAMAKTTGAGLSQAANRCDQVADGPEQGHWSQGDWHFLHKHVPPDRYLSLAVKPAARMKAAIDWIALPLGIANPTPSRGADKFNI